MPNPNHIQKIFERLALAYQALDKMLRQTFPQEAQREAAEGEIHQCIGSICDVYMEIGLCCGTELMRQFRQH